MPTGEMIAGYFTKPLQGALFRKMRDQIQGIDMNDLQLYKQQYNEAIAAKKAHLLMQYNMWKKSAKRITFKFQRMAFDHL